MGNIEGLPLSWMTVASPRFTRGCCESNVANMRAELVKAKVDVDH